MKKRLREIVNSFSKKNILVIGDIILDHYIIGDANRRSQEAPVLILNKKSEEYRLGGAGNVAANVTSLSGKATLLGFIGNDENGKKILELSEKSNIKFIPSYTEKTIQKSRIVSEDQQLLRIDDEDISDKYFDKNLVLSEAKKADLIIISDYAKGTITRDLMESIKEKKRIIVDPKPKNKELYKNVFLITPNQSEALLMASCTDVHEAGKILKKELSSNVIITRGKDGMSIFNNGIRDIPTYAKEVYDITGAGDTVIATLGLALSGGNDLEEAAILANHSAGIVVGKVGTATAKISELEKTIFEEGGKQKTLEELKEIRNNLKKLGKKVIWTNGCYDILHQGHIDLLKKSKSLGDYLIVGLNSDQSVKKLKGNNRPIQNEQARTEIISALQYVDYVIVFPEKTVEKYLFEIKPDIYVKGEDYTLTKMDQTERKAIESYNGKIVFIPMIKGISTTEIIKKARESK